MGRPKGSRNKNLLDLTGKTFDNLTVLYEVDRRANNARVWLCICCCGKQIQVYQNNLCKRPEMMCVDCTIKSKTMGESWRALRNVYEGMIGRCYSKSDVDRYSYYGERGITVCDRWLEPDGQGFLNFKDDMGERPDDTTLDRVDFDGNYCPENCRWVVRGVQSYNRRKSSNNTSGRTGVSFNKSTEKWASYISYNGEFIRLGEFSLFEDAVEAREKAELKYYGVVKE